MDRSELGQIVLVLQSGGALASYQAGVYQAMHEAGLEPDWIIGTSIGAVNAALIAGNPPEARVRRLREFWSRATTSPFMQAAAAGLGLGPWTTNVIAVSAGVPGFFGPNPWALLAAGMPVGPQLAALFTTDPLERTLAELIDPQRLNSGRPRLTLGAADVRTSEMSYFDSRDSEVSIGHILGSASLPPNFPAVSLGDKLYWDGGLTCNSPVEAIFDDNPRRSGLIFSVQIWAPEGPLPDSIPSVLARMKDLFYSSRADSLVARQKQLHQLRHVIRELIAHLPAEAAQTPEVRKLAAYGCFTRMHVVNLTAPPLAGKDHANDIDFSAQGVEMRWQAGYADTKRVIAKAPWEKPFDKLDGLILHEAIAGQLTGQG